MARRAGYARETETRVPLAPLEVVPAVVPSFLVMLREGLEAALIVGIIAAYLVKVGRKDALRGVWIGVAAAVILSLAVAGIASATIGELPFVVQETIGGIASLAAVVVLTWMLFWMRRQGRGLKSELERGVDGALVGGSMVALAALAFVSVAREGLETVLFMSVVFSAAAPGPEPAIGAVLGLAVAVGIGVAIFGVASASTFDASSSSRASS